MPGAASEKSVWSLQGNVAELNCGTLSGWIDLTRPHDGLQVTAVRAGRGPSELLRILRGSESQDAATKRDNESTSAWPLPVVDSYTRGNDLVASYGPIREWPFSPQLYWRANGLQSVPGVLASISLLVSVQTHLLDTLPEIDVTSRASASELLLVSTNDSNRPRVDHVSGKRKISSSMEICCLIVRLQDEPLSYVEIMPPGDFREVSANLDAGSGTLKWRLFADFLEKGVIRRARLHAALLPRENDIQLAVDCCAAAQQLELPLTT